MRSTTIYLSLSAIWLFSGSAGFAQASTVNFGQFDAYTGRVSGLTQGQLTQSTESFGSSQAYTSRAKAQKQGQSTQAKAKKNKKNSSTPSIPAVALANNPVAQQGLFKAGKDNLGSPSPTPLASADNFLQGIGNSRPGRGSGTSGSSSTSGSSGASGSSEATILQAASGEPSWVELTPTDSPLTISDQQGQQTNDTQVYYSPAPAAEIWYLDANVDGGQSPSNILSLIASQFGVDAAKLTFVSGCDSPTSGCYQATGGIGSGPYSNNFTSNYAFTYLAVHYGSGELLLHWDDAISFFEIGGLPNGLSNYRAYSDVTAVPLPATLPLMLSGLGVLGFFSRRRRYTAS